MAESKTKSEKSETKDESKDEKNEERCWEGYEPTPGKKPYAKGSCKPKD